jgi:hypothetical protein
MSKALFRIYYQNNPKRLSACPITIHALLHIADSIEEAGPVWTSWAFPMERFCGRMQPAITSRRHPDACMARYIVEHAQLTQAALVHGFTQELTLQPSRLGAIAGHFKHESCLCFLSVNYTPITHQYSFPDQQIHHVYSCHHGEQPSSSRPHSHASSRHSPPGLMCHWQ